MQYADLSFVDVRACVCESMHARSIVCDACVFVSIMGEGNILDGHNSVYNEYVQCVMGLLVLLFQSSVRTLFCRACKSDFNTNQHIFSLNLFTLSCEVLVLCFPFFLIP